MKIICDWENCKKIGSYKAPIERDNSKKFRLLCLEHIKIFNKKWNYFSNMSNEEIEFFIKSDLTWHKPTKSFGSSENFFNILWNNALEDKLNIFKTSGYKNFKKTKLTSTDLDALDNFLEKKEVEPITNGSLSVVVPMDDMTYILMTLWKCRKSEKRCEELYEKYKALIPEE